MSNISPENFPVRPVAPVRFYDRLFDMNNYHNDREKHDHVNAFWSKLYLARIPDDERQRMVDDDSELSSIEIIPVDWDAEHGVISVVFNAIWHNMMSDSFYVGYPLSLCLKTDGTLVDENADRQMIYTTKMTGHVQNLLSETNENCVPLSALY